MKVFISWSGVRSHQVSSFLQDVLRQVFGDIHFYISSDMSSGERWSADIFEAIEECEIGIIVFTPENKYEPWVMFEAGGMAKRANSLVIPVYVDCDFISTGPLREFQGVRLRTKAEGDTDLRNNMMSLVKIIEAIIRRVPPSANPHALRLRHLTDQTWWEGLNAKLKYAARIAKPNDSAAPAEETPVLAYPRYRSPVTFEAMTRAVEETESLVRLSSVGLMVYWDHEPFRNALHKRIMQDSKILVQVILQDPATRAHVDQHKQMMGDKFKVHDLFRIGSFPEDRLIRTGYPLPEEYYKDDKRFSIGDVHQFLPETRSLCMLSKLIAGTADSRKGNLSLKLYKNWMLHSVIQFDHELYVFPYGVDQEAVDAPLFRFLPHQIGFEYYSRQFQKIDDQSYEITDSKAGEVESAPPKSGFDVRGSSSYRW